MIKTKEILKYKNKLNLNRVYLRDLISFEKFWKLLQSVKYFKISYFLLRS